ncbi:MAG: hypothetical protein AMXMBFR64_31700 [Myxococcales bacterium]
MKQLNHPGLRRLLRGLLLFTAFVALSASRASCELSGPDVVVVDHSPAYVPGPPVIYSGDVSITYDFGGWSCQDVGVWGIDFSVSEGGPSGPVWVEDWAIACDPWGEIYIPDLPLGRYFLTLVARDPWGGEVFWYDAWVYHEAPYTSVDVSLY